MKSIKNKLKKCLVIVLVTLMLFNASVPHVVNADETLVAKEEMGVLIAKTLAEAFGGFFSLDRLADVLFLGTAVVNVLLGAIVNNDKITIETIGQFYDFLKLDLKGIQEKAINICKYYFIGPDSIFAGNVTILNANIFKIKNIEEGGLNLLAEMGMAEIDLLKEESRVIENKISELNELKNDWNINNVIDRIEAIIENPGETLAKTKEEILSILKNPIAVFDDIKNLITNAKGEYENQLLEIEEEITRLENAHKDIVTYSNPVGFLMNRVGKAVSQMYVWLRNICALIMLAGLIFTGIKILLYSNIPEMKRRSLNILKRLDNGNGTFNIFAYNHDINI